MATLLQQILDGQNPEIATVGVNTATIIKTALALAVTAMVLILFGYLTQRQPLIASGLAIVTIVIALIYFNKYA